MKYCEIIFFLNTEIKIFNGKGNKKYINNQFTTKTTYT